MSRQLSLQIKIVNNGLLNKIWINRKLKTRYRILHISQCATNGREDEIDVVYTAFDNPFKTIYTREASEFFIKFYLEDPECRAFFEAI